MARVTVYRSLPPLKKVLPHFSAFPKDKSHQQVMIDELREAAKKVRTVEHQPFYSMRKVAAFFRVPLGTISPVYKALEREGIINCIRSSHTILIGKKVLSRQAVRGVVGIPIWMHSIALQVYTRTLAMELEEQLRHSGYVADMIFHAEKKEETDPGFAARLLSHRLDVVVLHTPLQGCRQNILSLRERGVRVLVIQRSEAPRDLPAVIYLLDYETAYRQMAARWFQIGLRKVWLWGPLEQLHYQAEAETFKGIIAQEGLELESFHESPAELLRRLSRGPAKAPSVVAFIDTTTSEYLCNNEPQVVERISRLSRLAFCLGSIRVPFFETRKIRADVVSFSPTAIASRLADDICRLSVLLDGVQHAFSAHYEEQIPF